MPEFLNGIAGRPLFFKNYTDLEYNYVDTNHPNYFRRQYALAASNQLAQQLVRDRICNETLYFIDIQYNKFEGYLRGVRDWKDFGTDAAVIGLNAAGAITGTAETKAILAAISGGLVATSASADKVFFREKTIEVLELQMQALRKAQLATILMNLKADTTKYPLEAVLRDLTEYYFAGTLPRAFQALSETVGGEGKTASVDLKRAKSGDRTPLPPPSLPAKEGSDPSTTR
jgi:hypothetical protein